MACLIAPATAAIITGVVRKKIPAGYHVNWLLTMLWGGVLMLLVDHLMTGEIVPYPPFITAGIDKIVTEVIAVGIPMTLVVVAAWLVMVVVSSRNLKSAAHGKST